MRTPAAFIACAALIGSHARPCCGPISPAGERLATVLDGMHVESLWQAHQHINWSTGEADRDGVYEPGRATHCSAFAAAVGQRVGVYMLRPPEHGQALLASAQGNWFGQTEGQAAGWVSVPTASDAQSLANLGHLVVIVFVSPDPERPGHIVVVRPSLKSERELEAEGPDVIQAADHNRDRTSAKFGLRTHAGAWPDGVRYYQHAIP